MPNTSMTKTPQPFVMSILSTLDLPPSVTDNALTYFDREVANAIDMAKYGINTAVKAKHCDSSRQGKGRDAESLVAQIFALQQRKLSFELYRKHLSECKELAIQLFLKAEARRVSQQKNNQHNESLDKRLGSKDEIKEQISELEKRIAAYDKLLQDLNKKLVLIDLKIKGLKGTKTKLVAKKALLVAKKAAYHKAKIKYAPLLKVYGGRGIRALSDTELSEYKDKLQAALFEVKDKLHESSDTDLAFELEGEASYLKHQLDACESLQALNDPSMAFERGLTDELLDSEEMADLALANPGAQALLPMLPHYHILDDEQGRRVVSDTSGQSMDYKVYEQCYESVILLYLAEQGEEVLYDRPLEKCDIKTRVIDEELDSLRAERKVTTEQISDVNRLKTATSKKLNDVKEVGKAQQSESQSAGMSMN